MPLAPRTCVRRIRTGACGHHTGTLAVGAQGELSAATGIDGDQTGNAAPGAGAVYLYRSGPL